MNSKKLMKITLIAVFFVMVNALHVQAASIFDRDYYAYSNLDVVAAKGTEEAALNSHFEQWGVKEGRNPSIVFNAKYYLANNADVAAAYGNNNYEAAYNHFIQWGMKEGRRASAVFDVKYYLNTNTDVKAVYGDNYEAAIQHFMNYGMKEGRAASTSFDLQHYLANNADVKNAFNSDYTKAYYHYATYGVNEGHRKVKGTDHVYGEVKTTKATCDKEGTKVQTCVACGATKTETTKKLGHKYSVVTGEDQFTYTVNEDNTVTAVLNLVCANDAKHKSTVKATVVKDEEEPATCQDAGKIVCTATATYDGKKYENEKEIVLEQKQHEYTKQVGVTATCTKEGTYYNVCKFCGKEEESAPDQVIMRTGKLNHDYSKLTKEEKATCEHGGYKMYACTMCGATKSEELTDALPHDFSAEDAKTEAKPATCTEAGNPEYYTCKSCGKHYSDNKGTTKLEDEDLVIAPTTHDYTSAITTAPTCEADGVRTYTCKKCDNKYTETIAKTNHANKTVVEAKPATCGAKGNVEYEKCSDCGKYFATANSNIAGKNAGDEITLAQTEKDATGSHDYTGAKWITTSEATATTCLERYRKCIVCGHKDVEMTGHTAGTVTPATCTTPEMTMCTKCGKKYQTAPATGHTWNAGEITTAATCETPGVKTYTCTVCDETKTEEIPATGHNLTSVAAQDATCTANGKVAHVKCAGCNKYFVEDENGTVLTKNDGTTTSEKYKEVAEKDVIIPATDHKWDAGTVSKASTVTGDVCQVRTYKCTNKDCSATRTENIAHNLKKVAAKPATCTEKGNIEYYTCNEADEFYKVATEAEVTAGTDIIEINGVKYKAITKAATEESAKGHTFTAATVLDTVAQDKLGKDIADVRVSFYCGTCKESVVENVTLTYVPATVTEAAHYTATSTTANAATFYFDANLNLTTEEALKIAE